MSSRQTNTCNNRNNRKTHRLFFEEISESMLSELLHRADTNILKNDILQVIRDPSLTINTRVHKNEDDEVSLYIFYKIHNKDIGHISFHMFPNMNGIKKEIGILHIQNTSQGERPFRIVKESKNIVITISNQGGVNLTSTMKEYGLKTLDVLNKYLRTDKDNEPLSLFHPLTKRGKTRHKYLHTILQAFHKRGIRVAKTQKLRSRHASSSSSKKLLNKTSSTPSGIVGTNGSIKQPLT